MVRVTVSPASRRRRKRIFKQTKGFYGDRRGHIRQARNAVMSAMANSTKHRKLKKRDFRSIWIMRIGVAAKIQGISYSKLMFGLRKGGVDLNRKMLSEMAIHDMPAFQAVVEKAKAALVS